MAQPNGFVNDIITLSKVSGDREAGKGRGCPTAPPGGTQMTRGEYPLRIPLWPKPVSVNQEVWWQSKDGGVTPDAPRWAQGLTDPQARSRWMEHHDESTPSGRGGPTRENRNERIDHRS